MKIATLTFHRAINYGAVLQAYALMTTLKKNGLQVSFIKGKHHNNFPKQSDNPVSHVRPHGLNAQDTYELPDGRQYPKQCFWLNNSYIVSQLDERFLKEK